MFIPILLSSFFGSSFMSSGSLLAGAAMFPGSGILFLGSGSNSRPQYQRVENTYYNYKHLQMQPRIRTF